MLINSLLQIVFSGKEQRRKRIKKDLKKKGITLAEIANQAKVTPAMVTMVISGKAASKQIQDIIEEITGEKYFGNNGKK